MNKLRGIFLDRDGTINIDHNYVAKREDFVFIPGSVAAMQKLAGAGVNIHIVTNQAGIAKGLYTEDDFHKLTNWMLAELKKEKIEVMDVLYCPHHEEGTVAAYKKKCACRKPGTELFEKIMQREHYQPGEVAMIGDKETDVLAGKALGITSILVETGYGKKFIHNNSADFVFSDLAHAVDFLLSKSQARL